MLIAKKSEFAAYEARLKASGYVVLDDRVKPAPIRG
jgi:hypothetical protein